MSNILSNPEIKNLNMRIANFNANLRHQAEVMKITPFFKWLEEEAKPVFIALYNEDPSFTYISKKSVLILLRLNLSYRFIKFHQFGIFIKI